MEPCAGPTLLHQSTYLLLLRLVPLPNQRASLTCTSTLLKGWRPKPEDRSLAEPNRLPHMRPADSPVQARCPNALQIRVACALPRSQREFHNQNMCGSWADSVELQFGKAYAQGTSGTWSTAVSAVRGSKTGEPRTRRRLPSASRRRNIPSPSRPGTCVRLKDL